MGGSNSSSPSSSSRKRSYTSTDSAVVVDAAQRLEEAPATRPDETDYSGGNIPAPDTVRQNSSKAPAVHCEVVILPPKDGLVPQKRRKLTVGEKEELKAMKEAKARARMDERVRGEEKRKSGEEERLRKLEERRGKAEERRKQDEEKRARADDRRRLEELKRREKEAEKQQREDERLKKERVCFFWTARGLEYTH